MLQGLEYKRICKEMEELNSKKDILDAKVMALAQVFVLDRLSFASQRWRMDSHDNERSEVIS